MQLERVNIALVTSDGREPEGYRFQYFPDQNDAITWPSRLCFLIYISYRKPAPIVSISALKLD